MKDRERLLTHNCQIEAAGSCLGSLEIHTAPINTVIGLTNIKYFQSSIFRTRTHVEYDTVVPKDVCVHPMTAAANVSHARNVNSASGICKISAKQMLLIPTHKQSIL